MLCRQCKRSSRIEPFAFLCKDALSFDDSSDDTNLADHSDSNCAPDFSVEQVLAEDSPGGPAAIDLV